MISRLNETHRVFLDANILYAAAIGGGCVKLWEIPEVELVTSEYAAREAWICLAWESDAQRHRDLLCDLLSAIDVVPYDPSLPLYTSWELPDPSDVPILQGAIESNCAYLLTADKKCFGHLFGKTIEGVTVMKAGTFLAMLGL